MIYNLGVVPDLQISKKVDFLMIYMILFALFIFFNFFEFETLLYYGLGVVPDLQISKKVDFLRIYIIFFRFRFAYFLGFVLVMKFRCKMGRERSGEVETGSK